MKKPKPLSFALKRTTFELRCCPATARKLGDDGTIAMWRDANGWRWFVAASVIAERNRRRAVA